MADIRPLHKTDDGEIKQAALSDVLLIENISAGPLADDKTVDDLVTSPIILDANLQTNGFWLSGDGASEGVFVGGDGRVAVKSGGANPVLRALESDFSTGGFAVNRSVATGSDTNIFVGLYSGQSATTGSIRNIGIGRSTIQDTTTGDDNIAIGFAAVNNTISGSRNIGVGSNALRGNTTGFDSIAIGHDALISSKESGNVAVGSQAVKNLIYGFNNSIIGHGTGQYGVYDCDGCVAVGAYVYPANSGSYDLNIQDRIVITGNIAKFDSPYKPSYSVSTYSSGTNYTMTATPAALDFGTTDPVITLAQRGTYRVSGWAVLEYVEATYAGNETATLTLRRTNNTAADLTNGTAVTTMQIVSIITGTIAVVYWESDSYVTLNVNDSLTIFGSVSATPSAGSIDVSSSFIKATRIA